MKYKFEGLIKFIRERRVVSALSIHKKNKESNIPNSHNKQEYIQYPKYNICYNI